MSTGHIFFEFNYAYQSHISYEKNINLCSKSKSADELLTKLRELMTVYKKNFYYIQKLQKQIYNKVVKSKSYVSDNNIWLNNKYVKIK